MLREGTMKYRQWEFDPILLRETSVQMLLKFENMVNDVNQKICNVSTWTFELAYYYIVSLEN